MSLWMTPEGAAKAAETLAALEKDWDAQVDRWEKEDPHSHQLMPLYKVVRAIKSGNDVRLGAPFHMHPHRPGLHTMRRKGLWGTVNHGFHCFHSRADAEQYMSEKTPGLVVLRAWTWADSAVLGQGYTISPRCTSNKEGKDYSCTPTLIVAALYVTDDDWNEALGKGRKLMAI